MRITPQIWRSMTFKEVEEVFFALSFGIPRDLRNFGIYGFFEIKAGREYLRYIGKSTCVRRRLRDPRYHKKWLASDAVRVLQLRVWEPGLGETFSALWTKAEDLIDEAEFRLILKYNPHRNTHHVWRAPHEYCTSGRPV